LQLDLQKSTDLLAYLQKNTKYPFEGITQFASDMTIDLGWGEVVPLWFLQNFQK